MSNPKELTFTNIYRKNVHSMSHDALFQNKPMKTSLRTRYHDTRYLELSVSKKVSQHNSCLTQTSNSGLRIRMVLQEWSHVIVISRKKEKKREQIIYSRGRYKARLEGSHPMKRSPRVTKASALTAEGVAGPSSPSSTP